MAESEPRPAAPPRPLSASLLTGAGLVYLGVGIVLAIVFFLGGVQSSLFPTGWLFPAVLIVSGGLMTVRRRFDVVAVLWAGLTAAVFMLGVLVYVNALDLGLDDAGAFDATLIVAGFGFLALLLRPGFRS
jgi:hypothetical protein